MPRGGKRVGAGRKLGLPNKATQKRQEEVASSGPTPLATMLQKMRYHLTIAERHMSTGEEAQGDATKALDKAADAAALAAPYVHPRLAAVQHTGGDGEPIKHALAIEVVFVKAENGRPAEGASTLDAK